MPIAPGGGSGGSGGAVPGARPGKGPRRRSNFFTRRLANDIAPPTFSYPLFQTAQGASTGTSVSATWNIPTANGHNLLMVLSIVGTPTITTPPSWSTVGSPFVDYNGVRYAVFILAGASPRSGTETISYLPAAQSYLNIAEFGAAQLED